jgi:ribosome biogenesis GTPase
VAVVHRTCYDVVTENGTFQCELTGAMMYGRGESKLPCTGDWVIFQSFDEGRGIIVDMLPRERTLYRKKSGTVADRQAIAAWVNRAFIVQSLDDNFNPRRAERFMAQIMEAGIEPVLALNKADLDFNREAVERQIEHLARRMPVFFTSVCLPDTIQALRESISEGETVVFVGSSGVGKSSLVNALCGESLLATSDISLSTGKGRHTSTRREMMPMPGGGVLIDTPGVREFGLTEGDADSLAEMLDIDRYAASCRFSDCTHTDEPGCGVLRAVASGELSRKVYESYLKLRREVWYFTASEHEKRRKMKAFNKLVKEVKNNKGQIK